MERRQFFLGRLFLKTRGNLGATLRTAAVVLYPLLCYSISCNVAVNRGRSGELFSVLDPNSMAMVTAPAEARRIRICMESRTTVLRRTRQSNSQKKARCAAVFRAEKCFRLGAEILKLQTSGRNLKKSKMSNTWRLCAVWARCVLLKCWTSLTILHAGSKLINGGKGPQGQDARCRGGWRASSAAAENMDLSSFNNPKISILRWTFWTGVGKGCGKNTRKHYASLCNIFARFAANAGWWRRLAQIPLHKGE